MYVGMDRLWTNFDLIFVQLSEHVMPDQLHVQDLKVSKHANSLRRHLNVPTSDSNVFLTKGVKTFDGVLGPRESCD
jgi:hypothetical protein